MPSKAKAKARRRRNYSSDEEEEEAHNNRNGGGSRCEGSIISADGASPRPSSSAADGAAASSKAWPVLSMDGSGQRLDQWVAKQLNITRTRGSNAGAQINCYL